jgi:hypothetical protein
MTKTTEQIRELKATLNNSGRTTISFDNAKFDDYIMHGVHINPLNNQWYVDFEDGSMRLDECSKELILSVHVEVLRSQLSEAQENYEKVWDAGWKKGQYDTWEFWMQERHDPPPDKTTFINNLKKGK